MGDFNKKKISKWINPIKLKISYKNYENFLKWISISICYFMLQNDYPTTNVLKHVNNKNSSMIKIW